MTIRGQKVLPDADLAEIYDVPTKRLNEQVKRNADRFPEDFRFQLTREEAEEAFASRSQIATLKSGQNILLALRFWDYKPLNNSSFRPAFLREPRASV